MGGEAHTHTLLPSSEQTSAALRQETISGGPVPMLNVGYVLFLNLWRGGPVPDLQP